MERSTSASRRTDLGQANDGLGTGDLLRVMFNDIDDHLPDLSWDGDRAERALG